MSSAVNPGATIDAVTRSGTAAAPPVPGRNIRAAESSGLVWSEDDVRGSLSSLFSYVVVGATIAESWYWKRKTWKGRLASVIQWTAVSLTGIAAVFPIAVNVGRFSVSDSGLLASLLIGVGAALLGFDRMAGLSSSWTRYVLTATAIRGATEEFRLDWTALASRLGPAPSAEDTAALIARARAFRLAVEALITRETQDWATEFRQNMSMLEQELKSKVDQAQADREGAEQDARAQAARYKAEREQAARPGSVEAGVSNASTTDEFRFQVKLESEASVVADEEVAGSESWARVAVPAGQYKLTISATVKKQRVSSAKVVFVKPGETAKVALSLPS